MHFLAAIPHHDSLKLEKTVALKKVNQLEQYAKVLFDYGSSKENIASAGEKSMVAIYSGRKDDKQS